MDPYFGVTPPYYKSYALSYNMRINIINVLNTDSLYTSNILITLIL
jgi:hypothetical protein